MTVFFVFHIMYLICGVKYVKIMKHICVLCVYSIKGRIMDGTVKWFNSNKGYGFIITDDNKEFFVHWKSIVTKSPSELKTLEPDERVHFDTIETDKGIQAINIIRLGS